MDPQASSSTLRMVERLRERIQYQQAIELSLPLGEKEKKILFDLLSQNKKILLFQREKKYFFRTKEDENCQVTLNFSLLRRPSKNNDGERFQVFTQRLCEPRVRSRHSLLHLCGVYLSEGAFKIDKTLNSSESQSLEYSAKHRRVIKIMTELYTSNENDRWVQLQKEFSQKLHLKPMLRFKKETTTFGTVILDFFPHRNILEKLRSLSSEECIDIVIKLCDFISRLHHQQLMHGDIKLSNFLYDSGAHFFLPIDLESIRQPSECHLSLGSYIYILPVLIYDLNHDNVTLQYRYTAAVGYVKDLCALAWVVLELFTKTFSCTSNINLETAPYIALSSYYNERIREMFEKLKLCLKEYNLAEEDQKDFYQCLYDLVNPYNYLFFFPKMRATESVNVKCVHEITAQDLLGKLKKMFPCSSTASTSASTSMPESPQTSMSL